MKRNTHHAVVGLQALKDKHRQQLEAFERWAADEQWINFHHNHYD